MRTITSMACLLAFVFAAGMAHAADVRGSKDPPGIGMRYPGAQIIKYKQDRFDDYVLAVGKSEHYQQFGKSERLEGRVTDVQYQVDASRSTLEVMRNYKEALQAAGFQTLFDCAEDECGGRNFNSVITQGASGLFQETTTGQRYIAVRKGDISASVLVVKAMGIGGPDKDAVGVRVVTVEAKPMDAGLAVVESGAMEKALDATGHIAIYGITFDTDKDVPLPASEASIAEIGKLLKDNPSLKLHVVGHTDNEGKHDYNMGLSKRRAQSVVKALTGEYGIAADRLLASGVGSLAPVASNSSEEGRAKNRRVELVLR